jgi:PAS domain S-box-containing protein
MSELHAYPAPPRESVMVASWPLAAKGFPVRAVVMFAKCVSLAFLYYGLVLASMKLRLATSTLALIWPANALLVAVLTLSRKRHWWIYLVAVIPAHVAGLSSYHLGPWWLVYQIAANAAVAIACAELLGRYKPGILHFEKLQDVAIFLAVSIVVPALTSLLLIYPVMRLAPADVLQAHGWADTFVSIWTGRWITNSASILVFVPAILVCALRGRSWFHGASWRKVIEIAALGVPLIVLTLQVYEHVYETGHSHPLLYLVPIPFLLWAAVRFGPGGASLSITALVCVSSWCAYRGEGVFLSALSIDRVTVMQMGWMMVAAPLYCLAAVVHERHVATLASLENEGQFRQLFEQATIGVAVESLDRHILIANPAFCEILGYSPKEMEDAASTSFSNQDDLRAENLLLDELLSGRRSSYELEKRLLRKDGVEIWSYVRTSLFMRADGKPPLVLEIVKDITARKSGEDQLHQFAGRLIQAQEEERHRISRELHDDMGQQAAVLLNELNVLRDSLSEAGQPQLAEHGAKVHGLASNLAKDLQQLSHELHSSVLEHLGLSSALKVLCRRVFSQRPFEVEVRLDSLPEEMPRDVALCLYRVAQEAFTNVVRHSQARKIIVVAERDGDVLRLKVSDDGVGFDPATLSAGLGLTSMQERLRLVGGELLMRASANKGTEVIGQVRIGAPKASSAHA